MPIFIFTVLYTIYKVEGVAFLYQLLYIRIEIKNDTRIGVTNVHVNFNVKNVHVMLTDLLFKNSAF